LTDRRDLNIRVHHFLPVLTVKCYECDAMNAMLINIMIWMSTMQAWIQRRQR